MILIHYGATQFYRHKFLPITNNWVKPNGGLWTSPINSEYGWKDWNEQSEFAKCVRRNSFVIELNHDAKVFTIAGIDDLLKAPLYGTGFGTYMNFEVIKDKYDAIHLTCKGEAMTRHSTPNLCGWDCESVLLLNTDCFTVKHQYNYHPKETVNT